MKQEPATGEAEAPLRDVPAARAWLSAQPRAQVGEMALRLGAQMVRLDGSEVPAATRLAILDTLRDDVVAVGAALEGSFQRKPLPLTAEAAEALAQATGMWRIQALAYLRTALGLPQSQGALPLHRAAVALRLEQYAYLMAAYEVPPELLGLTYNILLWAERLGLQRRPQADASLDTVESHLAGQVAWMLLLQSIDPYRLNLAQLAVANRLFGRWRNLATFQSEPDRRGTQRTLPLAHALPAVDSATGLGWLNVEGLLRKIQGRIASLEAGEPPETIGLGRDLSAAACTALLRNLEGLLQPGPPVPAAAGEAIELTFGTEHACRLFAGQRAGGQGLEPHSHRLNHQRMAVFGFDAVAAVPHVPHASAVDGEHWKVGGGLAWREAGNGGRHSSPTLVTRVVRGAGKLEMGVLSGLHLTAGDCLRGHLRWLPTVLGAASLRPEAAVPLRGNPPGALLLATERLGEFEVVVAPTAGVRPGMTVALDDSPIDRLVINGVVERGTNFVRFNCSCK